MANIKESLAACMKIDGAIGAALVDMKSGMCLGSTGGGDILNMEVAAAGNTDVVRAKMNVMSSLGLKDKIEDMLITLGKQYHLVRMLETQGNLFIYLALHRDKANLGMARLKLSGIESDLET